MPENKPDLLFVFLSFYQQFFINTFDMNDNFCKESAVPSSLTNASCTCLDRNVEDISRLCLMTSANEQSSCLSCVTGKKGARTTCPRLTPRLPRSSGSTPVIYQGSLMCQASPAGPSSVEAGAIGQVKLSSSGGASPPGVQAGRTPRARSSAATQAASSSAAAV